MALVEYGGGVTAFRGSVGGVTFQSNRAGKIVRTKPRPRKVVTVSQNNRMAIMSELAVDWQNLSAANKVAWGGFADAYTKVDKWGNVRTLTAFNWFLSINANLREIGESEISATPFYSAPAIPPLYTVVCNNTRILLRWETEYDYPLDEMLIFTTQPLNRVTNSFRGYLRLTKQVAGSDVHSQYIETEWKSTHGLDYPPSGTSDMFSIGVACLLIRKSSGIASQFRIANSIFESGTCGVGCMIIESSFQIA